MASTDPVRNFEVFHGETLVGWSALENGDPPMGVAFGRFFPAEGYSGIRKECAENHADQTQLALTVRKSCGRKLDCMGVAILDYSVKCGIQEIEVDLLGIAWPLYSELFPHHVASYEARFKTTLRK